jgi:uncharacterized membrane protein HdeD (DUF308 family)
MKLDWIAIIVHGTIALVFGIVREIHRIGLKRNILILTNGIISLFVGISVFFLCKSFEANDYLTAFFTSISGWIGGGLMDFFEVVAKKIIERKSENL